ncbi:anthranilate phosphoribosyltransferase [Crassaminicella profunda]|uniref:anthranilate phosphoribosyltransferase n=1 Tax=Crassaminicella profunda TaxID=1286698 RepID=UPI001CA640C3|nr:anthranilate phosphoribosyltransferase [Crassaminicella profunda]QZY53652.1 anthranilate phosphoribosyltransferase [Crassaminicella profunda]
MLKIAMNKLIKNKDLTENEMIHVMSMIMEGKVTPAQIGGFLIALRMKGETLEEIVGAAKAMRDKSLRVNIKSDDAIDTCGTGGDEGNTFNISTIVAMIAAGANVTVLKHGNRSISSKCGSADVLEHLGVNIELSPTEVEKCVEKNNIGFMFAPKYHKAMKYAIGPRRELGIRTIFNVLGPLTNPARVNGQVLGVFDENLTSVLAGVLKKLGVERAMVVHGLDGLDEITITTKTKISELRNGKINTYHIDPRKFDIPLANKEEIKGGEPKENAQILLNILKGERGAKRNMVLLNAGAAIYVGKKANSLEEGIDKAKEIIDTGLALEKLNQLVKFSQEMKR